MSYNVARLMLPDTNLEAFIEIYTYAYTLTILVFILFLLTTSFYRNRSIFFISDISCFERLPLLQMILFLFFSMLCGLPPYLSFISKYYIVSLTFGTISVILFTLFLCSTLVYYLSVFRFLRLGSISYLNLIESLSFNSVFYSLLIHIFSVITFILMPVLYLAFL